MGDFNIDMLNTTDTTNTFLNTMSNFYIKLNILNPTRFNNDRKITSLSNYDLLLSIIISLIYFVIMILLLMILFLELLHMTSQIIYLYSIQLITKNRL